ncbi:MAG: recombinase family protein [Defluviitaleaceae bacterium]|nr:recombinase family protein [Defluviitaleaceae bacterium]
MTKTVRVACLYRVSTKKQVEENDIPMQKNACNEFIRSMQGWVLAKEYYEKGVSGYHKSAEQRDILQQVRTDAQCGLFDILLVFMFDRLGRREDETPFIVEWFVSQGIEVWSVKEGQQRFENRADKLINYIRFWQSGGESEKTSMRVKEKHKQMVEEGKYRGGTPPYGYKLVESENKNPKGYKLKKLAVDEKESEVVKSIFRLVCENGYGGHRVAKYLNEREIKTKRGNYWTTDAVMSLLKNPIYKGYYVSGKRPSTRGESKRVSPENWIYSNEQMPELTIINEATWSLAEEIRESRKANTGKYPKQTKGPLLFVGLAKCASCGANMGSRYAVKKWTRKSDNKEIKFLQPKYICFGRRATNPCTGQRTFSQKKIDPVVTEEVYAYLDSLQTLDLSSKIDKMQGKIKQNVESDLQDIKTQIAKAQKELDLLNNEIIKTLTNESSFTSEQLSKIISKKEDELKNLAKTEEKLQQELSAGLKCENSKKETRATNFHKEFVRSANGEKCENSKKETRATNFHQEFVRSANGEKCESTFVELQSMIPSWRQEFESSETDVQKMLLAKLIDSVLISNDGMGVHFKFNIFDLS